MGRERWAAAAAAVAGGLGVTGALLRRPWHDELYTLELARSSAAGIVRGLRLDSGPPGYYLLCHLAHLLGADSVRALRMLSVAAIVAGVTILVLSMVERRQRTAAVLLLAAHPLLLAAAADARAYGLLFLLSALVVWLLDADPSPGRATALAVTLAAACWVHALGLVLTGAVAVAGALMDARARRLTWLAALAALASFLPWLPIMLRQPSASLAWMARGWQEVPAALRWLLPVTQAGPLAPRTAFVDLAGPGMPVAVLGTLCWLVLLAAAVRAARQVLRPLALWVSAGAALVAATVLLRPVYAPDRADVLLLPAAVVVAAVGARRLGQIGLVLALVLGAGGAWQSQATLHRWEQAPPRPAAGAAAALNEVARPGDFVVTTGWWLLDVRHSLGQLAGQLHWLTFPAAVAVHPGWYDDGRALRSASELPQLVQQLAAAHASGHSVWLLRSPGLPSNRLLDRLVGEAGLAPVAGQQPFWELWGRRSAEGPE
ncbi:MAG: hypothetical protein LJE95_14850 [Acidobacteria bacterium]|nr:hypothetical protein [Acidobacteriota bacterium]